MKDKKINNLIDKFVKFLTIDLWRNSENEISSNKERLLTILRTIFLAGRGFVSDRLNVRASALAYTTLLAIVPIFAIIVGISKSFGVMDSIKKSLANVFEGQTALLDMLYKFVDSFWETATSGIVLVIGIFFLLSSTWSIIQNVEQAINDIYQVKKNRSIIRRVFNYILTIAIIPALFIISSTISVYFNTKLGHNKLISPFWNTLVTILPYLIVWLIFSLIYGLAPNTKVKIKSVIIAGLIAGFAFQAFQYIYISGQLWVNRYSAIYGSFAAIPLFLLWTHVSWIIILFGAEISFASQNIENYLYEKESKNVSHRYRYFVAVLIMNIICKHFEEGKKPLTLQDISRKYKIPTRLTKRTINALLDVNLISESVGSDKESIVFQPSISTNNLTVSKVFMKLFNYGNEDFGLDTEEEYANQWDTIKSIENRISDKGNVLVKDL